MSGVPTDLFAPVILSASVLPSAAGPGEPLSLRVRATDAARLVPVGADSVRLRNGKTLCMRRVSMAVEYESSHTGAELDAAVDQVAGLSALLTGVETLLAQVVGVPG